MTSQPVVDATILDLEQWRNYLSEQNTDFLFVTVSGAHIYGFPSKDSDVDLRGSHVLPLNQVVGLKMPNETLTHDKIVNGLEVDVVSHEVGKYLRLLVKNNGYILEQIFSPIVVMGQEFLERIRPLAQRCVTRNHYYHYRGFFANQRKMIEKDSSVSIKSVLYAYRVLATGIHLMNTGEIKTDLNELAVELEIPDIPTLIAAKVAEKSEFKFDVEVHMQRLCRLEEELQTAFEKSRLPEHPEREAVNDLLVQIRLG